MFTPVREVLRRSIKMRGDELVTVEREIDLKKFQRDLVQIGRLDRPQDDAANSLENAVDAFQRDAGAKAFVKQ